MKILKTPIDVVRVEIKKQGEKPQYITLYECSMDEVVSYIQEKLMDFSVPYPDFRKTSITVREARGGKNGKSTSFGLYCLLKTEEVMAEIISGLKE